MEFISGGDLFQLLKDFSRLSEEQTTFYLAEVNLFSNLILGGLCN